MHEFLKSIQILRFIAAASVLHFHLNTNPNFGSFGVDIFFVVSGFVIALVLSNGQSIRDFAINRIARITPLYWLLTTAIFIMALASPSFFQNTTAQSATPYNYIKSLFFIPYFGSENWSPKPLLYVGWTLNYEMFFYLTVLVSMYFSEKKVYGLASCLLLLTLASGKAVGEGVIGIFFGDNILLEFLLGFSVFYVHKRNLMSHLSRGPLTAAAILSYVLMAAIEMSAVTSIDRVLKFGIPATLLVAAFLSLEKHLSKENALLGFLGKMGDASYATYLTHGYVISLFRKCAGKVDLVDPYSISGNFLAALTALVVGHLTHTLLDRPLTGVAKNLLRRSTN